MSVSGDQVYNEPSIRPPSLHELENISTKLGLKLNGTEDLKQYQSFMKKFCENYDTIDKLVEPTLPVKYPRTPGTRPTAKDNPLNGWYWKTDIKGAEVGKLAGKTVAIKDNIAVAGVPMMNGCGALEGYMPEFDASVVTRILDEGGHIIGKAACENLCFSGSSFTSGKGTIRNPLKPLHSAGGSSGGSAALVASGAVDLAIGGDQGGSIRIPAAWCGIVGLKPTFGLVPYTGAMSMDPSLDHLGPMAKTVHDCALLLEVLAGYDNGLDPRQPSILPCHEYSKEIQDFGLAGLKIGIVSEGFSWPHSDKRVNDMVRKAIMGLKYAGAQVEEVSIPMLKYSGGTGHSGFYPTSMMTFAGKSFKTKAKDLSHNGKMLMLSAEYIKQNYPGQWYGKAQNLRRLLKEEYEAILKTYDVVAMPTVPFTAPKLPTKDSSVFKLITESENMSDNLFSANLTGFPALSINVGFIYSLPVGAHLEASPFEEVKLLNVARQLEINSLSYG